MPCSGTVDPADIELGVLDPADDPTNPEPEVSIGDINVVRDPDGTWWARFPITMTNINFVDSISMRWDTANGTASAGTHYVGFTNQTLVIPVGEGEGLISVQVLKPAGATGVKNFFVNLSVPSFCTIIDSQGKATVDYGDGSDPDPDPDPNPNPTDPTTLTSHSAWPSNQAVVYDQTADCKYYYACTGFAGGGIMSALYWKSTGHVQRFDAKLLFTGAGGQVCSPCVTGCTAFNTVKVMKRMRDNGVKHIDSSLVRTIQSYTQLGTTNMQERIKDMKRAIYNNGAIMMSTSWETKWMSCKKSNSPSGDDHVLATPVGGAGLGHAYIATGWNNNRAGGAFEIQSSYGTGWGVNGRCWMPYKYVTDRPGWDIFKLIYGG